LYNTNINKIYEGIGNGKKFEKVAKREEIAKMSKS
jgi:hypothetical protein